MRQRILPLPQARWAVRLTNLGFLFLRAWAFMLLVSVAHSRWWPAVPTIGYWWAFLVAALLGASRTSSYTIIEYYMSRFAQRRLSLVKEAEDL